MSEILETVMLVCFGLSWPMNVRKSWRARTAKAMSLGFLILVNVGYVAGIAAKFASGHITYVLAVYLFNFCMVFTNLVIYFRNRALDRAAGK